MKRLSLQIIAILILMIVLLTGCADSNSANKPTDNPENDKENSSQGSDYAIVTDDDIKRIDFLQNLHDATVYNISSFGAQPGSDCTTALQQAIDTVQSNGGGIIFFPAGIYYINQTITFNKQASAEITLLGESSGDYRTKISVKSTPGSSGIIVASDNVNFAHIEFLSKMENGAAMCITGDKTTMYSCVFRNYVYGYTDSLLQVCGTNAILSNVSFTVANQEGHSVNFTKLPGIESRNNKLIDSHIGGEFDGIIIDSQDPEGCPENILLYRLTFLNYVGGQLEIHAVKGCTVTNSMLDQGYDYCIKICPDGVGVNDLTIKENYISAAYRFSDKSFTNYGILITDGDTRAPIENISIKNNMIYYNKYAIYSDNNRISKLHISGNSVGDSTYSIKMKCLKDSTITANYFSSEFMIDTFSGENIINSNIIYILSSECNFNKYEKNNIVKAKGDQK